MLIRKKKEIRKAGAIMTDIAIAKKYRGAGIASKISVLPEDSLWLPSRHLYLNYTMGGGIPYGKICEIFGGESSGKSLVAMDFAYCAQHLEGIVLWNDSEQSFDPAWSKANGLDLDRIMLYPETSIEKISDWAADMSVTFRSKLRHNEPILLVTDSLAALDCETNINSVQSDAKAEMGNRAKAVYKYLRIRNQLFSELGIILIFINQLRKKLGATIFEDPDTTPGGSAMKFFAHQRMAFFQKKQITEGKKDNKIWLGNEVSIRMKKNKVAPPRPSFTTEIYFNEEYGKVGFNKYSNLSQLLIQTDAVDVKKGKRGYWLGEEKIAEGKDDLDSKLEKDEELRKKLVRKSGVNTLSKTQHKLDKLAEAGVNRYQVRDKKIAKQIEESDEIIGDDEE
jgi:recombination protein RecA